MTRVQLAPISSAAAGAAAVTAAACAAALGYRFALPAAGWLAALGYLVVANALLLRGLERSGAVRFGPANVVTTVRSTLVGMITGLVVASLASPIPVPLLVALAAPALLLDAVDGWVARRTQSASELGARYDMEVDAFLLLVLSVFVAQSMGVWVLAIGLMRYAFVAAGWVVPWLRGQLPFRYWRKVVTAVQGVALTIAATGLLPSLLPGLDILLVLAALGLLVESFGRDVIWLAVRRTAAASGLAGRATHDEHRDRQHDDTDRLDDHRLRHQREVPRLGDAEQPNGQGQHEREQRGDEEEQAQNGGDGQQPAVQREHRDRQYEARDRVEDEGHSENASHAVEDEEEMDARDGQEDDRAEDPHRQEKASAVTRHIRT
jgi:phosphatidylglycerophosphate synthase